MENNICHISRLPLETQNHIASYLVFSKEETEEEFIARTQTCAPIPKDIYIYSEWERLPTTTITAGFPNNNHIAIFEFLSGTKQSHLTIITNNDQKNVVFSRPFTGLDYIYGIAFSSEPNSMIALVNRSESKKNHFKIECKDIKSNAHLFTQKLNGYTYVDSIHFNKQGTHIIVHGINENLTQKSDKTISCIKDIDPFGGLIMGLRIQDSPYHYTLFPIIEEQNHTSKKTLLKYFNRKIICKSLSLPEEHP